MLKKIYVLLVSAIILTMVVGVTISVSSIRRVHPVLSVLSLIQPSAVEEVQKYDKLMDDPAYAPVVNVHPEHFMTLKGHIAATLVNQIDLAVLPSFETYDKKCSGVFEPSGRKTSRNKDMEIKVVPDSGGNYVLKFPLDYFEPGKCNWRLSSVSYGIYSKVDGIVTDGAGGNIVAFREKPTSSKNIKNFRITRCDKKLHCEDDELPEELNLYQTKGFVYQLNINDL